jgi:hypothetical protein
MTTFEQRGTHAFKRQERKGWLARLRDRRTAGKESARDDWPAPVQEPAHIEPHPAPRLAPPRPAQHPQFAHQPAYHVHVAIRMQRILVEASWDPELTPSKLWASLNPLHEELRNLMEQEQHQQRRMARNQEAAAAQALLLTEAATRGAGEEASAQAAAGMAGRAAHVALEEQTGVLPLITEGMADPRIATLPADVSDGDGESAVSPVHGDGAPPIPAPSVEFLAGEGLVPAALPRRPKPRPEPAAGLAHEVHAPGPSTALPVQGVTQTAVLPVAREDDGDDG